MTTKRQIILGMGAAIGCGLVDTVLAKDAGALSDQLSSIEAKSLGRLGVSVLDTGSGMRTGIHADDRFPMCSTFKLLACAAVLKQVDMKKEALDRRLGIGEADIVPGSSRINAPIPEGKTISELCEIAMTYSDNTAGNLILGILGGPEGVTNFARSIGANVSTRLD
jgi:beta-lactamase class A